MVLLFVSIMIAILNILLYTMMDKIQYDNRVILIFTGIVTGNMVVNAVKLPFML